MAIVVWSATCRSGKESVVGVAENYDRIRRDLPPGVKIVIAGKTRSAEELLEVLDAGAECIGENYVQEARDVRGKLGPKAGEVSWHMIGHLQKNKINAALPIFDVIQTIDSYELAVAVGKRVQRAGKESVSVLLEINIADEVAKSGVRIIGHERAERYLADLVRKVSGVPHVRMEGLMTMGPDVADPELLRPYFREMKQLFDAVKEEVGDQATLDHLSMGMSDSYRIAVEEGSNMVRIGTAVFGPRRS